MRGASRTLTAIAAIALIWLAGCSSAGQQDSSASGWSSAASSSDDSADDSAESRSGSESEPPPLPAPDGTFTSSCTYVLGDFTQTKDGYRFLADAQLENTGNIGTVDKVTATWLLAGGEKITKHKTVRVKPGKSKQVGLSRVASIDEIDRHQAMNAGEKCSVDVTMIDTFGEPQPD